MKATLYFFISILCIASLAQPVFPQSAGFGASDIEIPYYETWQDLNHSGTYEEGIDQFTDRNQNKAFDALWLGGFQQARPASSRHTPLQAIALVLKTSQMVMALVAVDLVGLGYDDVKPIQAQVKKEFPFIQSTLIASTHTHSSPDTIGIWGPNQSTNGRHPIFMENIGKAVIAAIARAVKDLEPAKGVYGTVFPKKEAEIQNDSRPPYVHDRGIHYIQLHKQQGMMPLGHIVFWSNHPEVMGSKNTKISADFPFFLRAKINDTLGGTSLYFNGAIGGSTNHDQPIWDEHFKRKITVPGHTKAKAVGHRIADAVIQDIVGQKAQPIDIGQLSFDRRQFSITLQNPLFIKAIRGGILTRILTDKNTLDTEVSLTRIGSFALLGIPGELYPEIFLGGVEAPAGQDHPSAPVEAPALKELLKPAQSVVIGLANDELGYLIPKSQWDQKPPYTYNRLTPPYGEINSIGPHAGSKIYEEVARHLIEKSKNP